ncbi:iron complex transport system substrate-binding protein [Paenibacillus phyllosphaerae]|uniref:Iron complex transport system substrate-binding protein n=1 Tax=Paenibacillus phyllosphaerae TaxID=274593 RepID=A0A7W5FPQ0_9BACL|nr:ABC transporter substrate-binding protein [Paenibacillus phyllosphaerae]MBB3112453.1 iron complex transport system substrate-binding protein [Paenibacillus phyllosphaerae]
MKKAAIMVSVIAMLTAGCGQPAAAPDTTAAGTSPQAVTVTDFAGRTIAFDHVPQSIAALSNGEVDIVYALGGEVVGRPASSSPVPVKEAEEAFEIGSTHGIDLEKLALIAPDVVLGNNPMNAKDIPSVESLGSKMVLSSANSIADIKKQITLFGQLLQREDKAAELNTAIDDKLAALQTQTGGEKTRVLLVYGAPGTYMAALNNSLGGDILTLAGGENIAADYPSLESYPQYAQLNTEKIVESNPQLVLLMSHTDPDNVKEGFLKEMAQNAAWSSLDAVKNNRVEVLPADLFGSNPGTRVTEALDRMSELLASVKP